MIMGVRVLVVMGSDSDFPSMKSCVKTLRHFDIPCEVRVCSAHRTPDALHELVRRLEGEGLEIIIAGAGHAAALAGVCASLTTKPVIGVPLPSSDLAGVDSLYATVQMPAGIPVASMGIGNAGARNAGLFAVSILALGDPALTSRLRDERAAMADKVQAKDAALRKDLDRLLDE